MSHALRCRSLAVTCEAVERFDTSVQLLQRCSDEVQQLEKYVTKLGTTDAVLWGQPPAHHHPLSSLIESQPLDERTADFFLPTLWVSWVASPFPNLESVSAVESRAQQVAAEQNRLRGRRTGNRHSTYSCQEPDHPLGGVMAFSQELAVARVRILTRMATSYKRLRNRAATRACCLQVHQLYVDRLRVDLAQHVVRFESVLFLMRHTRFPLTIFCLFGVAFRKCVGIYPYSHCDRHRLLKTIFFSSRRARLPAAATSRRETYFVNL